MLTAVVRTYGALELCGAGKEKALANYGSTNMRATNKGMHVGADIVFAVVINTASQGCRSHYVEAETKWDCLPAAYPLLRGSVKARRNWVGKHVAKQIIIVDTLLFHSLNPDMRRWKYSSTNRRCSCAPDAANFAPLRLMYTHRYASAYAPPTRARKLPAPAALAAGKAPALLPYAWARYIPSRGRKY